jgi:hypothetical protein
MQSHSRYQNFTREGPYDGASGIGIAVAVAIGLEGWMQNAVADRIELELEGMTTTDEIGRSGVKREVKVEDKKGGVCSMTPTCGLPK